MQKKGKIDWIYGVHACLSALKNFDRECFELYVDAKFSDQGLINAANQRNTKILEVDFKVFKKKLPIGAIHQGVALAVGPLPHCSLQDIFIKSPHKSLLCVLDQITDPQNLGAIIRSAAAFGVNALILPKHQSVPLTSTVAKSASGALEIIPVCYVSNLTTALDALKKNDYWIYGLDESGDAINSLELSDKVALIIGAEGAGMRRLTKEKCDYHIRITTSSTFTTLNASNAAAIALHQCFLKMGLANV